MHEIIHIVDSAVLAFPRPGLEIEAVNNEALAPGYYFVLWSRQTRRGRGKRYFGPFPTRIEARMMQKSAMALGLAAAEPVSQSVAECRSAVRRAVPDDRVYPLRRHAQWQPLVACAA